eukprot:14274-Eustigmatos_ZCMA.PRE.1
MPRRDIPSPSPFSWGQMVEHAVNLSLLVFGGFTEGKGYTDDVYELKLDRLAFSYRGAYDTVGELRARHCAWRVTNATARNHWESSCAKVTSTGP